MEERVPGDGAGRAISPGTIRYGSPTGRRVLLATVLGSALSFIDATVVNIALPRIGADLDAGAAGLQWVVNGYTLSLASLVLLAGALSDRHGRRRVFVVGASWFAATSLLCGLAPTIEVLVAARVAYATGRFDDARNRLATILDRWSNEPQAFQGAAPLWVETFIASKDWDGAAKAVERVKQIASTQGQGATDAEARGTYQKTVAETDRLASAVRYQQAKALLDQGNAEEAAHAFEALAQQGAGDVAAALVGAAVAWDKAGNAQRALQLRQEIVDKHADSRLAPGAALQLAAAHSKQGDHVGAARVYALHAEKWPDDPNHCTALRNGAVELDLAKRGADAAQRYLAFGKDDRCVQASPDVAALALHRAGELFMKAKRRPDAREAFQTAAAIEGVKSPEAKQRVADAARQAKKLGGTAAGRRSPRR